MTYAEALSYIHGVSNFFCKPGLVRIKELCSGLGDPQNELKFIHVTGTNGKGSVCSMLHAILREEGYRVGLYTSPYVRSFNERIRVNGKNITNGLLAKFTQRVKNIAKKMEDRPTEFEIITAIAFDYFRACKCDYVILEVGMGGRLDATNIIPPPLLSIITGISIDHTAFLGDTPDKIAYEKAGIIKEKSPTLYGGEAGIAEDVIAAECVKMQSTLYKTDYSALSVSKMNLYESVFDYRDRSDMELGLLGAYQPRNAAIVLDAADILIREGVELSEDSIRYGLRNARWPARFEIIGREPTVIFDGAHNPQGIDAAVDSIKTYFPDEKVIIISGVLRDKDYGRISDRICEVAHSVYTITPSSPRALSCEEYAAVFASKGVDALPCSSVAEALSAAKKEAAKNGKAVLCLGSLYTYCEVMAEIEKE